MENATPPIEAGQTIHGVRQRDAAVELRDGGESVLTLDDAPDVPKDCSSEATRDRREELAVVAEADGQGPREGEHPLAVADRRQNVVDEERRSLGHTPAHARRAEPAALAREGHTQLIAAAAACRPDKALREVAAHGEAPQLVPDEVGQRGMTALLYALEKAREVMLDEHGGVAAVGVAGDVDPRAGAHRHRSRRCNAAAGEDCSESGVISSQGLASSGAVASHLGAADNSPAG